MNEILHDMAGKVQDFNKKVTGLPELNARGMLSDERFDQRLNHIFEELAEAKRAQDARDPHEVVDGMVDVIYLAIGTLLEMGVPPDFAFDEVHRANMEKQRGNSVRNGQYEAVKPAGWNPPDHGPLLERMAILNEVSQVFVDITRLRVHKGKNYNRGTVKREDHFPLGHYSYFQMLAVKYQRIRSFVESLNFEETDVPDTHRLIRRELNDLMVYACFYAEWMDGGKELEK